MVHVAILGAAGSAGIAAAEGLLDAYDDDQLESLELSLIDGGEPGGLCILRGCMPSKDVLSAAEHRFLARTDDRIEGITAVDIEATVDRKDEHVADFASHRAATIEAMAKRHSVTRYREHGQFVDGTTLSVGDTTIAPEYVVVATGSTPTIPSVSGIETVDVRTSDDVLEATTFPDRALIIGFGFIGMELAPYLAEVGGVDVTVIDRNDRPLSGVDPAFGEAITTLYEREFGIEITAGASADRIERIDDDIAVHYRDGDGTERTCVVDGLYAFAGRTPNVDGLKLPAAGIEVNDRWVTDTMQTVGNPRVFVVGDANGHEPILHVAKEEGHVAAENIVAAASGAQPVAYDPTVHRVAFSGLGHYPFVRVGHSAASARRAGFEVVTATRRAADDGVFRVKGSADGLAKLVVDAATGRILGYIGVHLHADVFAKLAQVLVETGQCVDELPDRAYHPTTPELVDGLIQETAAALENA